jgi:hypothetical protein
MSMKHEELETDIGLSFGGIRFTARRHIVVKTISGSVSKCENKYMTGRKAATINVKNFIVKNRGVIGKHHSKTAKIKVFSGA